MGVPLAVVVPTRNRVASLQRLLRRLAAQVVPPAEIVVVDDGSRDGTAALLRRARVRHVRLPGLGPAAARNAGAQAARSPWLLFLGDDVLPALDLVAAHGEALEGHGRDPRAAVLGSAPFVDEAGRQGLLARWLTRQTHPAGPPGTRLTGYQFHTANVTLHRDPFWAVGGFDPSFPAAAGEDVELGLRLTAVGLRLYYHPECRADHLHPLTWGGLGRRRLRTGRALRRLRERHPGARVLRPPWRRRRSADPRLLLVGVWAAFWTLWGYAGKGGTRDVSPLGETGAAGAAAHGGGGDRLQPHGTR